MKSGAVTTQIERDNNRDRSEKEQGYFAFP